MTANTIRPAAALGVSPLRTIMSQATAFPIALALWLLTTIGDYATTAEVGFTLLYLLPIGVAVWWRGLRAGLLLCLLSTASFVGTFVTTTTHDVRDYVFTLTWNLVGEVGVFLSFALVLDGLRKRIESEVSERESVVEQLRHADRLNTVGKLASGIAHELGTPLNVVAGRASLIASRRLEGEDACKSAQVIVQQTERMTTIIQNLMAFARRGGSRKAPVDLNRLVKETATLLRPLAKDRQVEILVEGSSQTQIVPVNAGEMQQVLTNLVMNAVQAMTKKGRIRIGIARQGEHVQIKVRDEGTGITPDVLPHIFDPFFTTKDVGTGTGLGLSVTFGIVRDHGGFIDVKTKIGEGSEFIVHLPQNGAA